MYIVQVCLQNKNIATGLHFNTGSLTILQSRIKESSKQQLQIKETVLCAKTSNIKHINCAEEIF